MQSVIYTFFEFHIRWIWRSAKCFDKKISYSNQSNIYEKMTKPIFKIRISLPNGIIHSEK